MAGLTSVSLALSFLVVLCQWATVMASAVGDQSDAGGYLKRSLCNTFGGCSGMESDDFRFTGRSFSEKESRAPIAYGGGGAVAGLRPPYAISLPTRRPPYASRPIDDLRELPVFQVLYKPAFDNSIGG